MPELEQGALLAAAQTQKLSQQQILSLRILSMDIAELNAFLQEEFCANPLLELKDPTFPPKDGPHSAEMEGDRSDGQSQGSCLDKLWVPAFSPLQDQILSQIGGGFLPGIEEAAAKKMAACLDDNGYYGLSWEETASLTGLPDEQNRRLLARLQELEPAGVFARSLEECVQLQLQRQGEPVEPYARLLACGWDCIAAGRVGVLADRTGMKPGEIRRCIARIVQTTPRPISLSQERASTILPDLLFVENDGEMAAVINDQWIPDYRFSDYYCEMMKRTDDSELAEYFQHMYRRASGVLQGVQQRRNTMLRIGGVLARCQEEYIRRKTFLQPLTIQMVAETVGLHPSTVGRAVRGKYVQCPWGCVAMKSLFCTAANKSAGDAVISAADVRRWIRETVEGEDRANPYRDEALAEMLAGRGIFISRRAIAKYRKELMIPSSYARKKA